MKKTVKIIVVAAVIILVMYYGCGFNKIGPFYGCFDRMDGDSVGYQISFDDDKITVSKRYVTYEGVIKKTICDDGSMEADATFEVNGKSVVDHLKFEEMSDMVAPTDGGIYLEHSTGNVVPNDNSSFKRVD